MSAAVEILRAIYAAKREDERVKLSLFDRWVKTGWLCEHCGRQLNPEDGLSYCPECHRSLSDRVTLDGRRLKWFIQSHPRKWDNPQIPNRVVTRRHASL